MINASVPGYTAFQEVAHYRRHLQDIDADLVIWAYCLNDNHKFLHKFDRRGRMLFTDEARKSLEINTTVDRLISRSYLLTAIKVRWGVYERPAITTKYPWELKKGYNTAWKDDSWGAYELLLKEMKRLTSITNSKLVLLAFPIEQQIDLANEPGIDLEYVFKPQLKIRRLAEENDIEFYNLKDDFLRRTDVGSPSLFRDGLHFSESGQVAVADAFKGLMVRNQIVTSDRD